MSLKRVITTSREIDKQWQRWRSPDRRRLLVNARTAMNYSTLSPIVERLQQDPRLEFYFTASENPANQNEIYAEASYAAEVHHTISSFAHAFRCLPRGRFSVGKAAARRAEVQTFHGVAGKYRTVYDSPDHSMRDWDRLFFINKRRFSTSSIAARLTRTASRAPDRHAKARLPRRWFARSR